MVAQCWHEQIIGPACDWTACRTWRHGLDSDWMRAGVEDPPDVAQRHPQHGRAADLQDDVTHGGPAPMGRRDERELAVVGAAPDGQAQLPGGSAQWDEALLHLCGERR